MVLAMMARYLAFATRNSNSSMMQIHKDLEDAARTAGAGRLTTLLRITFPLLLPPFIAGWVWIFAHTLRNFSVPLMLATQKNQTLAVLMYHFWQRDANFPLASALAVVLLFVVSILLVLSRRVISQGFTQTQ
jgi:iron(III) transport system permease protein